MKSKKKENKNIGIGFLFCFLIGVIVLISFIFKTYISIKNSKYDSSSPFIVQAKGSGHTKVFEALPSKLKVLDVKGEQSHLDDLAIPVSFSTNLDNREFNTPREQFLNLVLGSREFNFFDKIKFFIFVKTLSQENVITKELILTSNAEENTRSEENFLNSPDIVADKSTIQIINATGESNVAGKFAKEIETLGGNVILTTTNNSISSRSSLIYKGKSPPIVSFIEGRFNITGIKDNGGSVADVTIVLGKDSLSKF